MLGLKLMHVSKNGPQNRSPSNGHHAPLPVVRMAPPEEFCIRLSCSVPIVNTLRLRQNGRHFADDTFKPIFVNENIRISITISLKFVPKVPIYNIPALVQIMAWRRPGDKSLSEPMMDLLLTHICLTRPQWGNTLFNWVHVTHICITKRSHIWFS